MIIVYYVLKFIELLQLLVLLRVVISWFDVKHDNPISKFIHTVTQPIFDLVHKVFPNTVYAMIDFAPIIAIIFLIVFQEIFLMIINIFFRWM